MNDDLFKGLTEEQIARAKACKNSEEILELAKNEGIELTDEQLEAVSGGCGTPTPLSQWKCPKCHKKAINWLGGDNYECEACGFEFTR